MHYACEVRAYGYLERVQLQSIKRIYNLSKTTPNSFVHIEYEITPIKVTVLKVVISLIIKLLEMDNSRIPRICYNILHKENALVNNQLGLINFLEKALVNHWSGYVFNTIPLSNSKTRKIVLYESILLSRNFR